MLRADGGVIEACGNGMRQRNLSRFILQYVRICALQHARYATAETSRMLTQPGASAAGLYTNQADFLILNKFIECADSIRSPANAGDYNAGQTAFFFQNLLPRFLTDDALKITHHHWIRMCSEHTAQQIVCGTDIRDPIA